jgi:ATP-dependent Lhr-like helicase
VGASTRTGAATLPTVGHRASSQALRVNLTTWTAAIADQLMTRHGVLTREAVRSESVPGGFSMVYPVLKAMADSGRLRRGYFVAGLGAAQFALPGALDLLRSPRERGSGGDRSEIAVLAATDPANPYGAALKWPAFAADATWSGHDTSRTRSATRGPARIVGAGVVLVDGGLAAYIARGGGQLLTWLPDCEPGRSTMARLIARALIERARSAAGAEPTGETGEGGILPRGMLIEEIDGVPPGTHALAPFLVEAGFIAGAMGFQPTFPRRA